MSSSASGPSPDPHPAPSTSPSGAAPDDAAAAGTAATDSAGAEATDTPGATAGADQPTPQLTTKQASRINAPVRGMVISMLVLLLLLLPFLWLQPRPDAQPYRAHVDVAQEATFAADQASFTPAAPDLGESWSANYARWDEKSQDGVPLWNVGFLSPDYHLVDMVQTAESNPTWLAQRTELVPVTDEKEVAGVTWQIHHRDASGKQDAFTAWVGTLKDSTVVLSGDAPDADFQLVAEALSRS
ncbi:MAG: DUF4245 domain-containing protein [Kocuria sp.]|uniref:DUF4245 domain-containing protein n=1 Tax=Kocuria sp. TaxID=1871328 RepID=UPI0026DD7A12|nr:DUF4245 domain-containing protein [Kocuria sp.]MDO4256865.1 DUF4245 domain-containing protein [Kocuria sp.]